MEDIKYMESPNPEDKKFTYYWDIFILDITRRANFKRSHLEQLFILCQLYVEFHSLTKKILKEGYTYTTMTRNGEQQKKTGNVVVRDNILAEIRQYSKLLKLELEKDSEATTAQEESEWI